MKTTYKNPSQLKFGDSDQSTFQICNFLVNVLGNMYNQWTAVSNPHPPQSEFSWGTGQKYKPTDICPVTEKKFSVDDFSFGPLIWSTFENLDKPYSEPFGSVVKYKDGRLFLAFRGSKSLVDFLVDSEYTPVAYSAPLPNAPSNLEVETGWYKVYNGLLSDLREQLKPHSGKGKQIIITGHSLGSTLATLAVPEAIAHNMEVYHYNSASPMVGLQSFADYYNSLTIIGSSLGLLKETFRLVNNADRVTDVPNILQHQPPKFSYVSVGTEISFTADYSKVRKNHDPCCTYAYALWNPDSPRNPDYDKCAKKKQDNDSQI
jgi:hypothetical protein